MLKHTKHNLARLEDIFRALRIHVRYEKGNFQSGYCMVSGKNMVIVNKFFDVEARIGTLLEILDDQHLDVASLPDELQDWLSRIRRSAARHA